MPDDPDELTRELSVELLDSFEKLEALLAVARAESPSALDALVATLRMDARAVEAALAELVAQQALAHTSGRYSLASGPWSKHVTALLEVHLRDRMRVVTIMSEAALKRLRTKAARAFADAFVFRPKEGDPKP